MQGTFITFKFTVWEPCLNNSTSNTCDLLSASKCGSRWQLLSTVHRPRSSRGDKVLNRPTVLAMWGVTLIDVCQWISLNLLCRKLSATLRLYGRALSSQHHGSLDLKDIKQICRFRERRAPAPVWSRPPVAPAAHFVRLRSPCAVFFPERKTGSFSTDLSVSTLHDCQSPVLCDTKSSEKVPPVKIVNLPLGSVRAEGERKSSQLSLQVMSVTGSYAIWLHSCSLCRTHTKETPELSTYPGQRRCSAAVAA